MRAAADVNVVGPSVSPADARIRIGDVLVDSGAIGRDALEATAALQYEGRLGEHLVRTGLVDELAITRALSEQLHLPIVDLRDAEPEEQATTLVSAVDANLHDVLPLLLRDGALTVAVADPLDEGALALLATLPVAEVHLALGCAVAAAQSRPPDLSRARRGRTATSKRSAPRRRTFEATSGPVEPVVDRERARSSQVVNKIVTQALRDRASDVHIEPAEDCVRVRFRIDGALKDVVELPAEMAPALVSRVKIMAEMNIVERRRPQDGQFEMNIDDRDLDVRVSTTSTIWGEKTVLRLLDRTRSLYRLADLGMPEEAGAKYSNIVASPFGMVIVGGPTGKRQDDDALRDVVGDQPPRHQRHDDRRPGRVHLPAGQPDPDPRPGRA